MGSPAFALPTLEALVKDGSHEIIACYTQPDSQKDRGKTVKPTIIAEFAERHGIPTYKPKSLRNKEAQEEFKSLGADIAIVAAYGLILPQEILSAPKHGAINIHPSKLPRWRGAAPIQRTIMAGDAETSICIMQMSLGLDEGDIILSRDLALDDNITAGNLHDLAANLGADLTIETLIQINEQTATFQKQNDQGVTYASKISKNEAELDLSLTGKEIINLIRGLNPYPGAFINFKDTRLKIFKAKFQAGDFPTEIGNINCETDFQIRVKDGIIFPEEVQMAGKKRMLIDEFIRGQK